MKNLSNAHPDPPAALIRRHCEDENNEVICLTLSKKFISRPMHEYYKFIIRCGHLQPIYSTPSLLALATATSIPGSLQLVSAVKFLLSSCAMKLQATAAATVACLVMLFVTSEMVVMSEAAGCDIFQMVPCMAASKNARVTPSKQCCTNIASIGKGLAGAKCLCSLLNHRLAKSNGVVPRIALGIPQKCRIAVPKGFVCQGIRVPGS